MRFLKGHKSNIVTFAQPNHAVGRLVAALDFNVAVPVPNALALATATEKESGDKSPHSKMCAGEREYAK